MRNTEIADALLELAVLYELDGAVSYRVLAYRQAARVVRDSPVSIEQLAAAGRLTELRGIGDTLAQKITTLLETGEIPSAAKLKAKYPVSLVEITRVPGLGAKTARRLFEELGIADLDDLREAAEQHRLREVKGLGAKLEENVLSGLPGIADRPTAERRLLPDVLEVAEQLAVNLRGHSAAERVEIAGSARRRADTCKDIDLIAATTDPEALSGALVSSPLVAERRSTGRAGASVLTHNGIPVDLRVTPPESFGNLLQHFSGSAEHNVALREVAQKQGLSVSEHGIADIEGGGVTTCATEEEVYERLGFAFIEPELRENSGELEAAREGSLPELVQQSDIRGDLHCHTTLSDGRNTLTEMAEAARSRGYSYLATTDHSASHGFGNNVDADQLWRRIVEVRKLNEKLSRFRVLAGSEVNILPDGSLDYADDLLAALDWVIASVHTSFRISEAKMTERVVAAIEHPHVDCIGHLTGRLLLRRQPYAIDVERVFEAAARTGTMLEINGNPRRRDLSSGHARLAAEAGVKIVVNTDAHGTETMANMAYGIATARRGWLTKPQVANTRSWREFAKLLKR